MSEDTLRPVDCRYCWNTAKVIHRNDGSVRYALVQCRSFNCCSGPSVPFIDEDMPHKNAESRAIEAWNAIHDKG